MPGLQLLNVHKSFGTTLAVDGVSFSVSPGEIVALLGPSGCGKSTVLAMIAGLEPPDEGSITWDGVSLQGVPPNRRGFGLMFQDYVLFPHMNVAENISFGMRMQGIPADLQGSRLNDVLELVNLAQFSNRDVATLSGGEQQRVALARSLAPEPTLLMLDEPLGALDRTLREQLLLDLARILQRMHQTALYVTHDQQEAFAIADRVVIMNSGRVEQIGTPQEIYCQPGSEFIARFLGLSNLIPVTISTREGRAVADTPLGSLPVDTQLRGPATLLLRPDGARLDGEGELAFSGEILQRTFLGSAYRVVVLINGTSLTFDFPSRALLPPEGKRIDFYLNPTEGIQVFPRRE